MSGSQRPLTWVIAERQTAEDRQHHDPQCIPDYRWRPNSVLRTVQVMGEVHYHYVVQGSVVAKLLPGNVVMLYEGRRTPTVRNRINDVLTPMGWKVYASLDGPWHVRSLHRPMSRQFKEGLTLTPEKGSQVHTDMRNRVSSEVD